MRKLNAILIVAMTFVLAAPCIALADKKKTNTSSGKDLPTESITLNYTKTQNTYTEQRINNPKPKSGVNGGSAIKTGTQR